MELMGHQASVILRQSKLSPHPSQHWLIMGSLF